MEEPGTGISTITTNIQDMLPLQAGHGLLLEAADKKLKVGAEDVLEDKNYSSTTNIRTFIWQEAENKLSEEEGVQFQRP